MSVPRLPIPPRDDVIPQTRVILDRVYTRLGFVPNLHRALSISPQVLEGFTAMSESLATVLDYKTRVRIAIAVSQANGCNYCVSSHMHTGRNAAGLDPDEMELNRQGNSFDPKAAVAVSFARKVNQRRGKVHDQDILEIRQAGYTDAEILEITALCIQTLLTNTLNNVLMTEVDFPPCLLHRPAYRDRIHPLN
jgi:uncharacterized peroxidase-related enzyme